MISDTSRHAAAFWSRNDGRISQRWGLSLFLTVKQHSDGLGCVSRVNHVHYQPEEYGQDSDMAGYEDGDYDHDYHSDSR